MLWLRGDHEAAFTRRGCALFLIRLRTAFNTGKNREGRGVGKIGEVRHVGTG